MLRVTPRATVVILLVALAATALCASAGQSGEGSVDDGGCRGIPPPELEGPWYLDDMTLDQVGTGDRIVFKVQVFDVSGVDNVTVEHWRGREWPHEEDTMSLASGNATEGVWQVFVQVPLDSLVPVRYRFHARDPYLNKNWTAEKVITVADDDRPYLNVPYSFPNATSGQPYRISAVVRDNIGVANVKVLVVFVNTNWKTKHVDLEATNTTGIGNGTWEGTIPVPSNFAGTIRVMFRASDTSGIPANREYVYILSVDMDPPKVSGSTPVYALVGDDLVLSAEVEDNIGVVSVWVVYHLGEQDPSRITSDMTGISVNAHGNGSYGSGAVPIPGDDIGVVHYTLYAKDAAGNVGSTAELRVEIIVNEPPRVVQDLSDPVASLDQDFHIRASLVDDRGIAHVWASYTYGGVNDANPAYVNTAPEDVGPDGSGTYSCGVRIPDGRTGRIWYRFEMVDIYGSTAASEWFWRQLQDGIPPTVGPDLSDTVAERGKYFAFRVVADDNIGVTRVRLTYWFNEGPKEIVDLEGSGTYALYLMVPTYARGQISYRFTACDDGGNENSTLTVKVPVINPPPIVLAIPPWTVTEGEVAELDLSDYIGDPNDDQNTLSLSCDDPSVSTMGLTLRALFDRWAPEGWLEFAVTDGSVVTQARVRLTIVDVNHPPTVCITSLHEGDEVEEGARVPLVAEYGDPDLEEGRDLRVTWSSSATGAILTFNHSQAPDDPGTCLPPGFHTITVTVSDGECEASDQVTVFVKGDAPVDPAGQGGDWSPFAPGGQGGAVVLLLAIAVGLSLLVLLARRRGMLGRA